MLSRSRAGAGPGTERSRSGAGPGRHRPQGRAGRRCGLAAGRDRLRAGEQRRGVRALLRAEGRAVSDRLPSHGPPLTALVSRGLPAGRHVLVHRLRRARSRPTCCPAPGRPRAALGRAGPARHHDRRRDLPGRCGRRRRPPGHDGQHDRPARHREGLPGRRVLHHRHRRLRRASRSRWSAVPGRAGALREDRGRAAFAGRQGQPAGHDDPAEPRSGPAGPGRRAAVRRLGRGHARRAGSSPTTPPAGGTRSRPSSRSAPARCSPAAR